MHIVNVTRIYFFYTMRNKLLILVGLCRLAPHVSLGVQHKSTVNEFDMQVHRMGF
jgi:hypothetical protein